MKRLRFYVVGFLAGLLRRAFGLHGYQLDEVTLERLVTELPKTNGHNRYKVQPEMRLVVRLVPKDEHYAVESADR